MAATLVSALPDIAPVRDILRAVFADAADPASGREGISELEAQLEVEDIYGSGSYRRIGEFLNPYDYDSDIASVYLHRALLGTLAFERPSLAYGSVFAMDKLVKRYRVLSRDLVDGEPDSEFVTSSAFHAWMAGKNFVNNQTSLTEGYAYLFLSTRPVTRRYFPGERVLVYILPLAAGSASLKITYTDLGGTVTESTESLDSLSQYRPVYLNYFPETDGIASFKLEVTGLTGTAPALTYQVVRERPLYFAQLIYGNSLGGFDSLPMTGKLSHSNQPSGEMIETALDPDHDGQDGNYRAFNQKATDTLVLRTGYMPLDERRALRDMALHNEVYIIQADKLRKLLLENVEHLVSMDGNYLYAAEFNACYAFDNLAYNNLAQ